MEVRKAKPADPDTALQAAVGTHSFPEINASKMQTSGSNNISTETPFDTSKTMWLKHQVPTEMLPKTIAKIARTAETVTNIGLLWQDRDEKTTFPALKKPTSPTTATSPEPATISGISLEFTSRRVPIRTNKTEFQSRSVLLKKNANIVAKSTILAVSANYVSIVAKLAT